jgi:hypothetical protein
MPLTRSTFARRANAPFSEQMILPSGYVLTSARVEHRDEYVRLLGDGEVASVIPSIPQPYTMEIAEKWIWHRLAFAATYGIEGFCIRSPTGLLAGGVGVDDLPVGSAHTGAAIPNARRCSALSTSSRDPDGKGAAVQPGIAAARLRLAGASRHRPLAWFPRLLHATVDQRNTWRISAAGFGIHWPDVDEDLSSEGLLRGAPAAMRRKGAA